MKPWTTETAASRAAAKDLARLLMQWGDTLTNGEAIGIISNALGVFIGNMNLDAKQDKEVLNGSLRYIKSSIKDIKMVIAKREKRGAAMVPKQ